MFRPLRQAPTLAKVVASLGLFLYLLGITNQRLGSQGAALAKPKPILPSTVVDVLGVQIPADRLWLLGLVVVATAVLAGVFQLHPLRPGHPGRGREREGRRAARPLPRPAGRHQLDDRVDAGRRRGDPHRPDRRARPRHHQPADRARPGRRAARRVPLVRADHAGRARHRHGSSARSSTCAPSWSWVPDLDWQAGLPLVIIVVIMAMRGERIPSRGTLREGRFPLSPTAAPHHLVGRSAGSAPSLVGLFTLDSTWRQGLIVSMVTALIALSIVRAHRLRRADLAHALRPGRHQRVRHDQAHGERSTCRSRSLRCSPRWSPPRSGWWSGSPPCGSAAINLAIATLAAATVVEELVLKWSWFTRRARRRVGAPAPPVRPRPRHRRHRLGLPPARVRRGVPGRPGGGRRGRRQPAPGCDRACAGSAVRANERAAAAAGLDVRRTKLIAFALSSFLAGLGGTLLAYQYDTLSVNSFTVFASLALLATTYLGGIASIAGALVAGAVADGGVLTAAHRLEEQRGHLRHQRAHAHGRSSWSTPTASSPACASSATA